jgi:hypothetical protein
MAEESLNSLVSAYKKSGVGRDLILGRIAGKLYREPRRFGFEGEDDASEALYRYRRRILGLADRYVDLGPPFEVYLFSSLRFLARTVRRERKQAREREIVCERSERWDIESRGPSSVPLRPGGDGPEIEGFSRSPVGGLSGPEAAALKKRIVFLYLKCAWEASDAATDKIAQAAGVPADWLAAASAQSLRFLEPERRRFEGLEARRDRSWARLCLLEERLHDEPEPSRRALLESAVRAERGRFDRACVELKAFRPIVPNSVVARILGVPKGTVDSGLYYLRMRQAGKDGRGAIL